MNKQQERFVEAALALIRASDEIIVSATATDVRFGKGSASRFLTLRDEARKAAAEAGLEQGNEH